MTELRIVDITQKLSENGTVVCFSLDICLRIAASIIFSDFTVAQETIQSIQHGMITKF